MELSPIAFKITDNRYSGRKSTACNRGLMDAPKILGNKLTKPVTRR
jgi:hypothetical protein